MTYLLLLRSAGLRKRKLPVAVALMQMVVNLAQNLDCLARTRYLQRSSLPQRLPELEPRVGPLAQQLLPVTS